MSKRYLYISPSLNQILEVAERKSAWIDAERAMHYSLWQGIMDGKLKPGTKIREDVVGEIFGVSRTLIRKVLYILEQEGIVTLPPNHGAFVASPSLKEAHDVAEAMRVLSTHVVQSLVRRDIRLTPAQRALIDEHIVLQREAERADDFRKARRLSAEFHILLAHQGNNKVAALFYEKLTARLIVALALHQREQYQKPRAEFQRTLTEQIDTGNLEGALTSINAFFNSIDEELRPEPVSDEIDLYSILAGHSAVTSKESAPRPLSRRAPRQKGKGATNIKAVNNKRQKA